MSTEQDSVRRLAEADAHALRALAEAWAEEHDLHDSVGAFEAGWEARQPIIDSLTAERDRMKDDLLRLEWWEATCGYWHEQANSARASAEALNDLWGKTIDRIDAIARRAEAAEAEVKRLREALERIDDLDQKDVDLAPSMARAALASTERSEATPPSEGGQS